MALWLRFHRPIHSYRRRRMLRGEEDERTRLHCNCRRYTRHRRRNLLAFPRTDRQHTRRSSYINRRQSTLSRWRRARAHTVPWTHHRNPRCTDSDRCREWVHPGTRRPCSSPDACSHCHRRTDPRQTHTYTRFLRRTRCLYTDRHRHTRLACLCIFRMHHKGHRRCKDRRHRMTRQPLSVRGCILRRIDTYRTYRVRHRHSR